MATTRARRLGTLLVLLFGAVLLPSVETAAASCLPPEDPRGTLARADAAFIGEFLGRKAPPGSGSPDEHVLVFRVQEAIKGSLGEQVEVRDQYGHSSISLRPRPGQQMGLFLRRSGDSFVANDCNRISPRLLSIARDGGPAVKRATDPTARVSFALRGKRLTVTVARDVPGRQVLGQRLDFLCFGSRRRATATGRFPRDRRRVTIVLNRDVSRVASECRIHRTAGGYVAGVFFFSRGDY